MNDLASTCIDVLRHGDTLGGVRFRGSTDDPLTDLGWKQMRASISGQKKDWDLCISSPLQRCAAFASEVSDELDIPVQFEKYFQEIHFGDWEGLSASELNTAQEKELGLFWEDPTKFTPPNAEAVLDFELRILTAWQQMILSYSGQRILLITHGGVMRCLLCHAQQKPIRNILSVEVKHAEIIHFQHDHYVNNNQHTGKTIRLIKKQRS